MNEEVKLIWNIIRSINKSWTNAEIDPIKKYFHDDVVMVDPNFQHITETKEMLLKSYKDFCSNAVVNLFKESEPVIDIVDLTAVASYKWEVQYEMGGKTHDETGKELLVFSKINEEWLIVWRSIISDK